VERAHDGNGRAWWKRTRMSGAEVGGLGEVAVSECSFMLLDGTESKKIGGKQQTGVCAGARYLLLGSLTKIPWGSDSIYKNEGQCTSCVQISARTPH
jgi:hypothetical protein